MVIRGCINILVWEGAGSSPASEGEVDGGAGGEVAWAVQGAVPGCGEKGGKVTPTPTPARCLGCHRLLLQGTAGQIASQLLENPLAARTQPAAANKVPRKQTGHPRNVRGIWGHPLPVGTESGERGRERVGEGVPTTKLFLLLLRQLGKKKKESLWGSEGRAGTDGLAHTRVHLYVTPCARGHGSITPSITALLPQGRSVPGSALPETG